MVQRQDERWLLQETNQDKDESSSPGVAQRVHAGPDDAGEKHPVSQLQLMLWPIVPCQAAPLKNSERR